VNPSPSRVDANPPIINGDRLLDWSGPRAVQWISGGGRSLARRRVVELGHERGDDTLTPASGVGLPTLVIASADKLFLVAERTAMPVADDTEAPSAAPGCRMISADLAAGPSASVVADGSTDGASFLVPL
jgi:hypothetical protein